MSRINTVPIGLQDLLGNTNFGDNPSELAGVTAPSLDLFPFLASQKVEYARAAANITARGQTYDITVPDGEYWLLLCVSMAFEGVAAGGERVGFSILLADQPGRPAAFVFMPIAAEYDVLGVSLGDTPTFPFWLPQKVLLQPGTAIRTRCDGFTGASPKFFATYAMFYKFRA